MTAREGHRRDESALVIRTAEAADLPVLRDLWIAFETWLNAIEADPDPVDVGKFDRLEGLAFGSTPRCTILLAEVRQEPVGYLVYYAGVWMDDMAPCLHVADLFVRETAHRKGIGRALMAAARTRAVEIGDARMLWTVWRKNLAAQKFYRRLGAVPFEEEVLMTWPAASPDGSVI